MMFVDRMFLLWYQAEAMAAALPAGMLYWTMVCFPFGVAQYVNTFVAQYHGAKRESEIGPVVWQGIYIGLATVPLFLCAIPFAPYVFHAFHHGETIAAYEITYFRWLTVCASSAVLNGALSSFFIGRGKTKIVMWANVVCTLINIVLDYVFVFGVVLFGILEFPSLGIAGAAIATVVSQWFKAIVYLALIFRKETVRRYGLGRCQFDPRIMWRLFRFGGPNGLQMLVESAAFGAITMFLAQLGTIEMSATTLAFNVNAVAFVPMVGVSIAVSTLVGQQLTGGTADRAARATRTAMHMGLAYSLVIGLLCLFGPGLFMLGHAAGVRAADFVDIRATTVVLLRYVAAYCLFDTLQIVFVGALKGAGDTKFVLLTTIVVSLLCVLTGWLGAHVWAGGLHWWWSIVTIWILSLSAAYSVRFLQGKWREMLVIEQKAPVSGAPNPSTPIPTPGRLRIEDPKNGRSPTKGCGRTGGTTSEK